MREILFRGKRVDNGEWVEGYYVYDESGQNAEKDITFIYRLNKHPCGYALIPYEVLPETVGQYTGLTDKNGKRIFEGDIIIELDGGMDGIPRKVVWDGYWMQFECPLVRRHWAYGLNSGRLWLMRDRDIKVIGTIHDNPELIGGDSDA